MCQTTRWFIRENEHKAVGVRYYSERVGNKQEYMRPSYMRDYSAQEKGHDSDTSRIIHGATLLFFLLI